MLVRGARLVTALIVLALCGCGARPAATDASQQASATVVVLTAASAQEPVADLLRSFKAETGHEAQIVANDSAQLAQLVINGVPAQLFLSASPKWTDDLEAKGLIARRVTLLGNRLVLIVPQGNPAGVSAPEDLLAARVKRIALAGPKVPAGMYARQALGKLGLLEPLEKERKIVSGTNVRATLAYAERGEVEAAIVYSTDLHVSGKAEEVLVFPDSLHDPIVYPLALLKPASGGEPAPAAIQLYDFLQQPPAAEVFRRYGFQWLGSGSSDQN